jgi:hypothetical protein
VLAGWLTGWIRWLNKKNRSADAEKVIAWLAPIIRCQVGCVSGWLGGCVAVGLCGRVAACLCGWVGDSECLSAVECLNKKKTLG